MNYKELTLENTKFLIQRAKKEQKRLFDELCSVLQIKDEDKYVFECYCFSGYASAEECGLINKYIDKD